MKKQIAILNTLYPDSYMLHGDAVKRDKLISVIERAGYTVIKDDQNYIIATDDWEEEE